MPKIFFNKVSAMCDQHNQEAFGHPDCNNCHMANLQEWENFLNNSVEDCVWKTSPSSQESTPKPKNGQIQNLSNYVWVTVNPKKDVSLPDLLKTVHKMYNKVWVEQCMYVFEIGDNRHNHSHGLIKYSVNFRKDKVKPQLANTVKNICDIKNDHCFCVRFIDEDAAEQKIHYMLGTKQDIKQDAVEATTKWREENNIEKYYINGTPNLVSPIIK